MPEQAAVKKAEAPADVARDRATTTGGPGASEGAVALAGMPAVLRPGIGLAAGGGRIPPAGYLQLQRRAGNRAVSALIAGRAAQTAVQREGPGDIPDEQLIADAIRLRDVGRIKMVKDLTRAKFADKISMIDILTDQWWVGPFDEYALETLWGSFGDTVLDVASKNAGLWEKSLKGGAELYKLGPVKPVADKFLADTRAIAAGFLDTNEKYTVTELQKLGVVEGDAKAPSEAEQAARQTELTAAIRIAREAQDTQAQLRTVPVALERRYEMFPGDRTIYFTSGFDPNRAPDPTDENPPPDRIEKAKAQGLTDAQLARTPWKDVKAQWDVLEAILQGLAIAYPAVGIALTQPAQAMARAAGDDPKAARAQIVQMLTGARDAIRETRPKLAGGLAYELVPIHNQLFAGTRGASGTDWKDPVHQTVAKEVLELKQNVEFWKTMGLATLAAAAFILAEFATAGLATAALVGFGVGLGAGQAIVAWEKALELRTAEKATTGGGTELLASGQADMAAFEAALATVMVFVDAFMAAKPLGKALSGAVDRVALAAGAKAGSKVVGELAALAGKAPDRALAERAIVELGAENVIAKSGKSATELLAIVGENSPVAARLKALAAIPADLAKLTTTELAKRARQLAVEISTNRETGEAIATLAVERFGPRQVLEMNGGWKNLSLALGNESAAGKSIMAWRDGVMGDIEAFVKTLPGGVDETGKAAVKRTGSHGKFTNDFDVSLLGPHASANRNAVRSFAAGRFGTAVDRLNELLLADFFTDPRRLHLYDQLDPLLRAEVGQRAEKVAEATIFAKTLHDAEEAGNKELAAQIREQMKALGVEEVPFKPLSEGDRATLYAKIDDFHQQLEQAIAAGDKAAQKDLVGKIGDTQGLINATEGGGYFSGGATRQIVTLAEGLLKGGQKPLDAQVYTTLLDQLPKLNEAASGLLKSGVVAGEDAVASIKGIAKYGNRFRELMGKLEVKVADEGAWNKLAERLQKLLHEAKGEADVTLLTRLETDATAVEAEVNALLTEFRASSQDVLMQLSRQAALANQRVDLNAIQFLVMATAKLTRTSNAIRESLRLIVAQIAEAAAKAGTSAATDSGHDAPKPGNQPTITPPTGAPVPGAPGGPPVQRSVDHRFAGVVQRDSKPPANLTEALRTGDSSALDPFRPFKGITDNQLLSLVNLIVTQGLVSWREESILEEAWSSYGFQKTLTESDYRLWESCEKRGANVKNVLWLRDMRSQFATDVRDEARYNLEQNGKTISAESKKLGIENGGGTPTPEASVEVGNLQVLAKRIQQDKQTLRDLGQIEVGYNDSEHGGTLPPGGTQDPKARPRAKFDVGHPPPHPPEPGDGMANWETVAANHRDLTASIASTINRHPALYALVTIDTQDRNAAGGTDAIAADNMSPADARKKIEAAFTQIGDNITKTRAAIDDQSLGFEALKPVHEKLFAAHPRWRTGFGKAMARAQIEDAGGDAAAGQMLVTLGTMALILAVEIGTAGAATPLIGALIGLTASGATAADSWNQWSKIDTGARSSPTAAGAVVASDQAEEAAHQAVLDTAFALLDLFGVGKAARAAASGASAAARVAGFEARLAAKNELKALGRTLDKDLLEKAVEREGAQAVVSSTGRSADELAGVVGRTTPAGEKLLALAGLKPASIAELTQGLPTLASKSLEDARTLVNRSIDVFGPSETMRRAGGIGTLERVLGEDAAMARLESWRTALIDDAEKALKDAAGPDARSSARTWLAERSGLPVPSVEDLLGLEVMFLGSGAEDVKSSAEGMYSGIVVNLEDAAAGLADAKGIKQDVDGNPIPVQRRVIGETPLPLTERQLDKLSPAEFEEVVRWAYRSGHWEAEGLPRLSVMELKINSSDHGLDGIGLRRRADLVDLYKLEMKQTVTGSPHAPGLHATLSGVQGGPDWARANAAKLIASDDPVAMETLDTLTRRLKRFFGNRYSDELLLEAFQHQLGRAPLIVAARHHAQLNELISQLRGLAKALGRGNVWLVRVRGKR